MRAYDESDVKLGRQAADILEQLEKLEPFSEEVKAKLNRFSEELFGFIHGKKEADQMAERSICEKILCRISSVSTALEDMSVELDSMLNELPQKMKQ